MSEEESK
jgi:Putative Interleukin 2 receptor, gamma chain